MRERFGKFVLLEDVGSSGLGVEYRAAKLGPDGALERLVSLTRLSPALSLNTAFVRSLMARRKPRASC